MPLQIVAREKLDVTGCMSVITLDARLQLSLNKTLVEKDLCIETINLVELHAEGSQSGTRVWFALADSLQAPLPGSVILLLLLPSSTRRLEVQRCAYTSMHEKSRGCQASTECFLPPTGSNRHDSSFHALRDVCF